jgi:hypothetical protein
MSKFQIGDKLRIRQWDDMVKEFGINENGNIPCTFVFTKQMKILCGQPFTVSSIAKSFDRSKYKSEEELSLDANISSDMLEPVPAPKPAYKVSSEKELINFIFSK